MPDTSFRGRSTLMARRVRGSGAEPELDSSAKLPMKVINLQEHHNKGTGEEGGRWLVLWRIDTGWNTDDGHDSLMAHRA